MAAIFLSASIPIVGRGNFYETADPFLIQCAVREFVSAALGRRLIVWGGHPAITPMIWAVCEDLGVNYSGAVALYQSRFFEDRFPEENEQFRNVQFTDAVSDDRDASLLRMRETMLSRTDLNAAVFIGGMEGIFDEHKIFTRLHPNAKSLCVPAAGGAALQLAETLGTYSPANMQNVDFASMFYAGLDIAPNELRTSLMNPS